jgi:predicted HicB family RNase H-like nuclease
MIRTSRALYARLTMEAAEQRVSLNQWVVHKLAERKPGLDW